MIPAPLCLISRTLLLGDTLALSKLMQNLLEPSPKQQKLIDFARIPKVVEAHYPRMYRPNEAELAQQRVEQNNLAKLEWLESLFDDYFVFDADRIMAKPHQPSDYAQMCAQIHPALPVAWKLSGLVNDNNTGQLALSDLQRILSACTTNFLPLPDDQKLWADLHVHLGGTAETSLSLFSLALQTNKPDKIKDLPSNDYRLFNK